MNSTSPANREIARFPGRFPVLNPPEATADNCRYQVVLTLRSQFKHLTRQQRREVWLDAMSQDEKQCELEEARALK